METFPRIFLKMLFLLLGFLSRIFLVYKNGNAFFYVMIFYIIFIDKFSAHPKIRAFIGHGGLLGTQEAIYHAVPMIVIPFFVEQDYQASRAHERQTAISLEISELTEEKLLNAILELLNNKKYSKLIKTTTKFNQ